MRPGGTDGQSSSRCRPPIISPSAIRLSSASSSLSKTKQDNNQHQNQDRNPNCDQVQYKYMTTITTERRQIQKLLHGAQSSSSKNTGREDRLLVWFRDGKKNQEFGISFHLFSCRQEVHLHRFVQCWRCKILATNISASFCILLDPVTVELENPPLSIHLWETIHIGMPKIENLIVYRTYWLHSYFNTFVLDISLSIMAGCNE